MDCHLWKECQHGQNNRDHLVWEGSRPQSATGDEQVVTG